MGEKKGVVLLSGGIDSAVTAAVARDEDFNLHAMTFEYGQRHAVELDSAQAIASALHVEHHIRISIEAGIFQSSALSTLSPAKIPFGRSLEAMQDIPATYVPGRNILFLSYALSYAESIDARDIFIGVNALDYSGYPDCRPEFIVAFEHMANIGTRAGIQGDPFRVRTPLLSLTKAEIIRRGAALGVDFSLTHSCYSPQGKLSCGHCDSCIIRKHGFQEAGIPDPTTYTGMK